MNPVSLEFDARRRLVTLDGRSASLQEKSWRVLMLLRAKAPEVVSRQEIIDSVWHGNYRTGDKGLNQAVWAIRTALSEDPREPRFIRTVPRVGYQWIHSNMTGGMTRDASAERRIARALTGIVLIVVATLIATNFTRSTSLSVAESAPRASATRMVATKAYLVDRDIHVELVDGCLGIIKNANYADIGPPVLSSDGTEVAVTVRESGSCRLVTIGLANGERRDFEKCPAI